MKRELTPRPSSKIQTSGLVPPAPASIVVAARSPSGEIEIEPTFPGSPTLPSSLPSRSNQVNWLLRPTPPEWNTSRPVCEVAKFPDQRGAVKRTCSAIGTASPVVLALDASKGCAIRFPSRTKRRYPGAA